MSLTAYEDTVFAVWGDVRSGKLNIYFVKTAVNLPISTEPVLIASEMLPLIQAFPNPASENIRLVFPEMTVEESVMEIFDISGKNIFNQPILAKVCEIELNILSFASGKYFVKMYSKNRNWSGSFIRK